MGFSTTSGDTNDLSIVTKLSFGQFDALLTGDMSPKEADSLVNQGDLESIEYIKIPHHGSKNGITKSWLDEIMVLGSKPLVVISVGKDNRYGHPHKEVIDLLNSYGLKILRTDQRGISK